METPPYEVLTKVGGRVQEGRRSMIEFGWDSSWDLRSLGIHIPYAFMTLDMAFNMEASVSLSDTWFVVGITCDHGCKSLLYGKVLDKLKASQGQKGKQAAHCESIEQQGQGLRPYCAGVVKILGGTLSVPSDRNPT